MRYITLYALILTLFVNLAYSNPNYVAQADLNKTKPTSIENPSNQGNLNQIAVLLPMHGAFKAQAEAVLHGFLSAYYALPKNQQTKIRIYDTSQADSSITDIYDQAVSNGANFVLGPLTKSDVEAIVDKSCKVPTLLLNYTQVDKELPDKCYEFGISPSNEAMQAAKQAWQANYDQALVISAASDWGKAIANGFNQTWQNSGGKIVAELDFNETENLAKPIADLMGVTQSNERAKQLRRILGQKVNFIPQGRDDIGVIFINADNLTARQIVPLLKFNFSGNTPIFATSMVYNGIPAPENDRDLDGVRFPIMPWAISDDAKQTELRKQFMTLWAENFRGNSKLYALGIDSLTLIIKLQSMQSFNSSITGVTGQLELQSNQQITATMPWAKFVNGKPVLIRSNTSI